MRFALAIVVLPILFYVYREVTRDVLIIDPFTVPKQFEEAGLTPEVMANRIGDKIRQMEMSTKTKMKKDKLTSQPDDESSTPNIEIPGTKLDLKTIVDITRSVFGIYPRHISGDITLPAAVQANSVTPSMTKNLAKVTVYVTQAGNPNPVVSIDVARGDVDTMVQRTAEMVLGQINPYVLAIYKLDHHEYQDSLTILQSIISNLSVGALYKAAATSAMGNILMDQKKYDEAVTKFQKAIQLDPNLELPYINWGNVLLAQKKYDEAIVKYQKAIQLDPTYALTYNNWGAVLDEQKKYDEAIVKIQKAIQLDPAYADAYDNWGGLLDEQNKYDEAIAKYQKAIELDPGHSDAYNDWGCVLDEQQKYDDAMVKYRKAIEIDPDNAFAYKNWGLVLYKQNKYKGAIDKYRKAIEINSNYVAAYNSWGLALYKQGKYKGAIDKYRKAIEIDPGYAFAYLNWARALMKQGKYDDAHEKITKANSLS